MDFSTPPSLTPCLSRRYLYCPLLRLPLYERGTKGVFPISRHFPLDIIEQMCYYTLMSAGTKRKRGAQPGNRNARKHGFYAAALGSSEAGGFCNAVNRDGTDPAIVDLRVRLTSVLRRDPSNRRVLREASRLLAAWCSRKYDLDEEESRTFKKFVRVILESAAGQFAENDGTNPACAGAAALKMTERIVAEIPF